jgi:hypothetical protein
MLTAGAPAPDMSFSRARALLLSLALLAPLAACRTTEELDTPADLIGAEPLPITLADGLKRWRTECAPSSQRRYRFGPALVSLFPAHDGRAFLSPVSAQLDSGFEPEERAFVARYEFTLALQIEGQIHQVVARGKGRSESDAASAEREAVWQCLSDLYLLARGLVQG